MELIILWIIGIYVISYRQNNGENVYRFFITQVKDTYDKFAPYSYKEVREKVKALGQDFTAKQYTSQVIMFAAVAGGISYLYFYNIVVAIIYAVIAIAFIPYLAYLRCKRFRNIRRSCFTRCKNNDRNVLSKWYNRCFY